MRIKPNSKIALNQKISCRISANPEELNWLEKLIPSTNLTHAFKGIIWLQKHNPRLFKEFIKCNMNLNLNQILNHILQHLLENPSFQLDSDPDLEHFLQGIPDTFERKKFVEIQYSIKKRDFPRAYQLITDEILKLSAEVSRFQNDPVNEARRLLYQLHFFSYIDRINVFVVGQHEEESFFETFNRNLTILNQKVAMQPKHTKEFVAIGCLWLQICKNAIKPDVALEYFEFYLDHLKDEPDYIPNVISTFIKKETRASMHSSRYLREAYRKINLLIPTALPRLKVELYMLSWCPAMEGINTLPVDTGLIDAALLEIDIQHHAEIFSRMATIDDAYFVGRTSAKKRLFVRNSKLPLKVYYQRARLLIKNAKYTDAIKVLQTSGNLCGTGYSLISDCYYRLGKFDEAYRIGERALRYYTDRVAKKQHGKSLDPYLTTHQSLQTIDFLNQFHKHFVEIPQPQKPKSVVFIAPTTRMGFIRLAHMALLDLKKRGVAILSLTEGFLPFESTGVPEIDQYANSLTQNMHFKYKPFINQEFPPGTEWKLDWDGGVAEVMGINFHEQFCEALRILRRNYTIDWHDPSNINFINAKMASTSHALKISESIHKNLAKNGIQVRYHMTDMSTVPIAGFRHYCDKFGDGDNFSFVQAVNSYESFYTSSKDDKSTKISVRNLTKLKTRSAYLAPKRDFEDWKADQIDHMNEITDDVEQLIHSRRTSKPNELQAAVNFKKKIEKERSDGKPVVCLMGKIVFDLSVPYPGGPAHSDIKDWLNHTIRIAKQSNINLLIKPHPHEQNRDIVMQIGEHFLDLIVEDIDHPNIHVLNYDWFTTYELKDTIDLATMWNGTSCLEFGVLGIPTLMAGHFAKLDYPIDILMPENRSHFENLISNPTSCQISKHFKSDCAALIKFTETETNSIPYEYVTRNRSNKNYWPPRWKPEQIQKWKLHGDKNVSLIADRIIE